MCVLISSCSPKLSVLVTLFDVLNAVTDVSQKWDGYEVKTDTDDIMGLIVDYNKLGDKEEDISSYINYIDEILSKDEQHFHPFSAIKVKIDDRRQSLHQWTQERKISMEDLPIKNVKVISKE